MNYWIKEQHDSRLPRPTFTLSGRMPAKKARGIESAVYGCYMHSYGTKKDYEEAAGKFRRAGESVVGCAA